MGKNSLPQSRTVTLIGMVALILLGGCESKTDEAYNSGYKSGHAVGLAEGIRLGQDRGTEKGRNAGERKAEIAVREGTESSLYFGPAVWALLAGVAIGLLVQYVILFDAKEKRRVPPLGATVFVPGMTTTLSFQLLDRKCRLVARMDDWLYRVSRQRRAKMHEIRSLRKVIAERIYATSSVEELVAKRYVALANSELDRIVREAGESQRGGATGPDSK